MHELPITQSILEIVLDHARRAGGGRITGINLVIGELSNVVDDCIQFYWDAISEGTPAEGALLHFERIPLRLECRDCEMVFEGGGTASRSRVGGGSRPSREGGRRGRGTDW